MTSKGQWMDNVKQWTGLSENEIWMKQDREARRVNASHIHQCNE